MNLTERLKNWTDIDFAMHEVAMQLGLVPENAKYSDYVASYWGGEYYHDLKDILERLVKLELLEFNEDENQFRANKDFVPNPTILLPLTRAKRNEG